MLFVTNRMPKQSNRSRLKRKISFDLRDTSASQHMFFCERKGEDDYIEIGNIEFFSQLKALPEGTQVLFYIHGFNDTAEQKIFPRVKKLQELLNEEARKAEGVDYDLVHVVPLIWPCEDSSVVSLLGNYWDDQRAADLSGYAFARFLGKFDLWRRSKQQQKNPCMKRVNILAHSMGNKVLVNALKDWAENESGGQMPQIFRNIFMIAADVENHILEAGKAGQYIPSSARNVVAYFANDDLGMSASKVANLKNGSISRRLGMSGLGDISQVPKNVYEVDCDNFNNTCDFPKGHTYFLDCPGGKVSPVVGHMVHAIKTGRVSPSQRSVELPSP